MMLQHSTPLLSALLLFGQAHAPLAMAASPRIPTVGMEFAKIPPGRFLMGSPASEAGRADNEGPAHEVELTRGFEMQTTHVTQYQWWNVMRTNPSAVRLPQYCPDDWTEVSSVMMCANRPVEGVSWNGVQEFIGKLNDAHDGYRYRLPTEAEWEYAARAGTQSAFYFGNDPDKLKENGWYYGNSIIQISTNPVRYAAVTHRVATKTANAFGLYDMTGNLWQWVQDHYDNYPSSAPVKDPTGPAEGDDYSARGGSYLDSALDCRSAARRNDTSGGQSGWPDTGFRLVRTKL